MLIALPGSHARLGDTLAEAWSNLRSQGRRSALALLGIMIGTASIIAMLNSGHMAQRESLKLFAKLGVDMLHVQAAPTGDRPALLSQAMIDALPRADPDVVEAIPFASNRAIARAGSKTENLAILGAPPALAALAKLRLAAGRHPTAIEDCALSAVLGDAAARALSAPAAAIGPGSKVLVGGYGYTVVGVLAPSTPETLDPVDYNMAVLISLGCSGRIIPGGGPTGLLVRLRPGADTAGAGERITARLTTPDAKLTVLDARSILRTMQEQKAVHSRMLIGIGAVSLLVGGIGVMNVMLMSVMERQREIGLRAATGATPTDIRLLFLVEAVLLTVAGGAIGSAFGAAIAWAIAHSSSWDFDLAPWTLALGPAAASGMGLIFGLYPAITASRLNPIEALRAD
ncbi:ABC transporter permease [Sphingomonas psychrotolerans]|uniref:Peptide ABC transporter permease n=1 Tax=Sphingomonas psychrotolerans TaxID=1327635 RepID=A0A2K8MGY9_9SPHN|nr:ABC transporter permease [Sphingomonas psychrotolerans]ATY31009.1 peptide ABC transporter permease [Sphingomonas psychrotolerans]